MKINSQDKICYEMVSILTFIIVPIFCCVGTSRVKKSCSQMLMGFSLRELDNGVSTVPITLTLPMGLFA